MGVRNNSTEPVTGAAASALLRDTLLCWFLLVAVLGAGGFLLGLPIAAWQLPAGLLLALAGSALAQPRCPLRLLLPVAAGLVALVLLAAWLSMWLVDQSWDGRTYHGPAIIALRDGWNPLQGTHVCDWNAAYCQLPVVTAIDHYPKVAWVAGAQFYATFGDLDAAKTPHLLALVLTALVARDCLLRWLPGQRLLAGLLALVLAGNPVSLAQLFSGYLDGQLASALTCQLLLLADACWQQQRAAWWRAAAVLPWLANIKLTGLVYGLGFIGLAGLLLLWQARPLLPGFLRWQVGAVLLAMVVGFNPFISNWRDHGNPFYPAYRQDATVIDQQAAPGFLARNRLEKFLVATFSVQDGDNWREPVLAWPLTRPAFLPMVETRYGGFGPLFSAAFPLALALLPCLRRSALAWLAGGVLASIFLTPAGWWARLAPQTWLAVVLVAVATLQAYRSGWQRKVAVLLAVLLLFNNLAVMRSVYGAQCQAASAFHADLARALAENLPVRPVRRWQGGDFALYDTRKLQDSAAGRANWQPDCEIESGNRIFLLCRAP